MILLLCTVPSLPIIESFLSLSLINLLPSPVLSLTQSPSPARHDLSSFTRVQRIRPLPLKATSPHHDRNYAATGPIYRFQPSSQTSTPTPTPARFSASLPLTRNVLQPSCSSCWFPCRLAVSFHARRLRVHLRHLSHQCSMPTRANHFVSFVVPEIAAFVEQEVDTQPRSCQSNNWRLHHCRQSYKIRTLFLTSPREIDQGGTRKTASSADGNAGHGLTESQHECAELVSTIYA